MELESRINSTSRVLLFVILIPGNKPTVQKRSRFYLGVIDIA